MGERYALIVKALEYGLNPLAITWKSPGRNNHGQKNIDNISELGVTHLDVKINPNIERKLIFRSFTEKGNPSIPMHLAIHSIPLMFANYASIPLILWAENPALTIGTSNNSLRTFYKSRKWFAEFGGTMNTTSDDWIDLNLNKKDLYIYSFAGKNINKVRELF